MKVIDPGHEYDLACLDGTCVNELTFVKRIGEGYPGNIGPAHSGTTTQEVLRALIDRTKYVNNQIPDMCNLDAIAHMRAAIRMFEERAAERHGCVLVIDWSKEKIEELPVDPKTGHLTSYWRKATT